MQLSTRADVTLLGKGWTHTRPQGCPGASLLGSLGLSTQRNRSSAPAISGAQACGQQLLSSPACELLLELCFPLVCRDVMLHVLCFVASGGLDTQDSNYLA